MIALQEFVRSLRSRPVVAAGVIGWMLTVVVTAAVVLGWRYIESSWLLDWHVHWAGARDLTDGSLYRHSLYADGFRLPVDVFNLPPMAAFLAVPLLSLPPEIGGGIWALTGAFGMSAGVILVAQTVHARPAWAWAGVAMGIFALNPLYRHTVELGNINPLMLGFVGAFVYLHSNGKDKSAGIVIGLAIAAKLWPLPLLLVVIRERRWPELAAAVVILVTQGLGFAMWLGLDIAGPAIGAIQTPVAVGNSPTIFFTALRELFTWWPSWVAPLAAAVVVCVPSRGLTALGLGILGGLFLIPNLWDHYAPTAAVALALIATDIARNSKVVAGMRRRAARSGAPLRWSATRNQPSETESL